jgi:hypothetical protein
VFWTIDVPDLGALLTLTRKVDDIIIKAAHRDADALPALEIYDDYRE